MKNILCLFIIFSIGFLNVSLAQDGRLSLEELEQQRVYTSMEFALEEPQKVYRLNLMLNDLVFMPNEISKLVNLQELDLSMNPDLNFKQA